MESFYFVYVLLNAKDGKKYVGFTTNLAQRFERHNKGEVQSTKHRRLLKLIYFEGCLNK